MLSRISRRCCSASLKGKNRLPQSSFTDRLLHPFFRRQIDISAQQICQPALQSSNRHQCQRSRFIEIRQKVNVRLRRRFAPRNRPKDAQMHNPRSPQFGSVLTKLRNDLITIHVRNPTTDRISPANFGKYPAASLSLPQLLHVWQAHHYWKRVPQQGQCQHLCE
jgi:hypothetical protein